MEKKFTFYARTFACTVLTLGALVINSFTAKIHAQNNCTSSRVLFSETFGTGTTATSSPDVLPTGLTYQATGSLANEGIYRVINSTQQKPEWHVSEDHTAGDINGKMLVVNGQAETFYSHRIDLAGGFRDGDYTASLFVMNVNTPGTCAPNPLLTDISLRVEYLSQANTWVPLAGSPVSSGPVAQAIDPTWLGLGATFNLPLTGAFLVKSMRIVLSDGTVGGCGNDFALDDITLSQCTEGGPTPVTFLDINARLKGSGVTVGWSTSQEFNNKSFDVEKSANGNFNWSLVASINGAGNSSTVKNYNAFDPQPLKGINFYRIKQVDIDGHFKYSKTVSVKWNLNKTGVSIIANPFHNSLTVDFSSSTSLAVFARLVDMTGKQVAIEKWSINIGNTRKDFSNVSGLQQGIYLLTVSSAAGEILYNNKVIKQ
jgi:hypothetical protein